MARCLASCAKAARSFLASRLLPTQFLADIRFFSTVAANTVMDRPNPKLIGIGNPLLDITISATDDIFEKYKLNRNDAILAEEIHEPLFEYALNNRDARFGAGGATQNSIRVAQWLLNDRYSTGFFGGVGRDKAAKLLHRAAHDEGGVDVRYCRSDDTPTGQCVSLIRDDTRSLVTKLGAAKLFDVKFLVQPENWSLIENASCIYIGGFFFPVSTESIKMVAELTSRKSTHLAMNLSAPFLIDFFTDPSVDILPHIDILVGNETEYALFAKRLGIGYGADDLDGMALCVSRLPRVKRDGCHRICIITQGSGPVIIAANDRVQAYPVEIVDKSEIVDTNGCGDAFMGGFLAQFVTAPDRLDACVRAANFAAGTILRSLGCTLPSHCKFTLARPGPPPPSPPPAAAAGDQTAATSAAQP